MAISGPLDGTTFVIGAGAIAPLLTAQQPQIGRTLPVLVTAKADAGWCAFAQAATLITPLISMCGDASSEIKKSGLLASSTTATSHTQPLSLGHVGAYVYVSYDRLLDVF